MNAAHLRKEAVPNRGPHKPIALLITPVLPSAAEGFDRIVSTIALDQPLEIG